MAEREPEGQRMVSESAEASPPHVFIYLEPCECCEEVRVGSVIITDTPPPWIPGQEELEATETEGFSELWGELVRLQQQANSGSFCGECEEAIRGLCDG